VAGGRLGNAQEDVDGGEAARRRGGTQDVERHGGEGISPMHRPCGGRWGRMGSEGGAGGRYSPLLWGRSNDFIAGVLLRILQMRPTKHATTLYLVGPGSPRTPKRPVRQGV